MWIHPCASHNKNFRHRCRGVSSYRIYYATFALLFFYLTLTLSSEARADETIIVAAELNQVPKGDYFVIIRDDGGVLVRNSDLKEMGIQEFFDTSSHQIDGENYLLLDNTEELTFTFNETDLTLEITAAPWLLPTNTIDLSLTRNSNIYRPRENSFFINYGLDLSSREDATDFRYLNVSNEVGVRFNDILLLTDSYYIDTPDESRWVRLNSSVIWDHENDLQRYSAGDFIAASGFLGSAVNMGGLSLSKVYQIDPYFINYPLFDFTGQVATTSEIELYANGNRIHSQRLSPGSFELLNYQGVRGAQEIKIIIRDIMGREQVITSPTYSTDSILQQGLHEYSYNLGFLREEFGIKSNQYDKLAFSAFHRYGVTDQFNLGGRTEITDGLSNGGIELLMVSHSLGLFRVESSTSWSGNDSGLAALMSYEHQTPRLSNQLAVQYSSAEYRTLATLEVPKRKRVNFVAKTSYVTAKAGSFGLSYSYTEQDEESARQATSATWSHRIYKDLYLRGSTTYIDGDRSGTEGSIDLSWNFGRSRALSAGYRHTPETDLYSAEARQNTPYGEGTGWSLQLEHERGDDFDSKRSNGFVQSNGRHAILRGDLQLNRTQSKTWESARLSLAGALTGVGGSLGLTRPVRDSFALVTIGESENVRVYVNGQNSGKTNHKGQVIIPDLNSYNENQISFEDKDISIDYMIPNIRLFVSTPLHSASCLNFPIRKYQAFTGTMLTTTAAGNKPLKNALITLKAPEKSIRFWTSTEGEFYLDDPKTEANIIGLQGCEHANAGTATFLPPGNYDLTVRQGEESFNAGIKIPASDETFIDMGQIIIQQKAPTAADEPPAEVAAEHALESAEQTGSIETAATDAASNIIEAVAPAPEAIAQQPSTVVAPQFIIQFPFDSSWPLDNGLERLNSAVEYLIANRNISVIIEGHASQEGAEAYNLDLGMRRASTVRTHLTAAGISPDRIISTTSSGERKQLCPELSSHCLQLNRRAVIITVK